MKKEYKKMIFILCGLAASSIGLCNNAVGVFYEEVSKYLGVLKGTFAFHATLSLMATALTSLLIPTVMQNKNYKQYMKAGIVICIISTVLMGFANHIVLFYILGIIRGIAAAFFAIVPLTIIINHWFEAKKGFATSIILSFSGISGAICSPILTRVINQYGHQIGYGVQAGCILFFCLPALLMKFSLKPEELHLLPYGYTGNKNVVETKPFNYKQTIFLLFCMMTFMHTSITGISQHMPLMARSIALSSTFGSYMMSLAMVGNISTKLLIGILSDYYKPVKACLIMIGVHMLSLALLMSGLFMRQEIFLIAGAFLFGSVYSVGAVGIPLLTNYFFGKAYYGQAYRIVGFFTNLGSAVSLTLIGYLYDYTQTYTYVFMIALVIHVMNITIMTTINKKTK